MLGFKRQISELSNEDLVAIFQEANAAMGLRMNTEDGDASGSGAFSQDILKIEIHGPDQSHLTVIDVPGIFRVATPGLTTEEDITLVENMVKSYMDNSRTIILAVMPCNVDIATQEILKLAEVADPNGARTMGVLTKPDLANEAATQQAVIDLVLGKRSNLKLGYYLVKNRGADDKTSTLAQRAKAEKAFFMAPPWTRVSDRCGVTALKERLSRLLMKISKEELPHVKADVEERLRKSQTDLETMGPARSNQHSQRQYLGKLAGRFQDVAKAALNGYYSGETLFKTNPEFRLITRIIQMNDVFSSTFWSRGHCFEFPSSGDTESAESHVHPKLPYQVPLTEYRELHRIIDTDKYDCPEPVGGKIMDCIRAVHQSSRGPELGTFGGTMLSSVFERQSEKWDRLALSHASNAIAVVHDFLFRLLDHLCPEKQVRSQLWDNILVQGLVERYRKAMDQTRFLLRIERGGVPSTFNPHFSKSLQEKRTERTYKPLTQDAVELKVKDYQQPYIPVNAVKSRVANKNHGEDVCEHILDTLTSYYEVARQRFVDVMCQQVISYYLFEGDESPIRLFTPDFVMGLDVDQLEMIAGEDDDSKEQRQTLEREVNSLEAALKVLQI
ncbi:hypothetical protein CDD83_3039 [Cordyceps sp. RAO-2017]|nr:hypothetical protein CDD83_3039 [Cordyceps sp. RAO-2017]